MANLSRDQIINLIIQEAQKNGIPPILALSIAMAESSFDPGAPGDAGESLGIFQINDVHELSREFRLDPEKNIKWWANTYAPPRMNAFLKSHPEMDLNKLTTESVTKIGEAIQGNVPKYSYRFGEAFQNLSGGSSGGEPWEQGSLAIPSSAYGKTTDSLSMAAGGIDEDELGILKRYASYKSKKKSSPALDRINQEIQDYLDAMPAEVATDPTGAKATQWLSGLQSLQKVESRLSAGQSSWLEGILDTIMESYITQGVPAAEAAAEGERLLKQFGLDVGAITDPYQMKRERAADDAGIIAENWLAERMKAQDEAALWNDKTAVYGKAADQAQAMFDEIFPFMVSKAGPHELNSMKAGGTMNQLFNRLGMEYTPPEPIGTTEINPVDYANQALIAAGPPPSAVGPPPKIPTMTEALGPVPELPTPPQLPKAPSMASLINRMMGLLEKEQSSEEAPTTPPVVGPGQFYGPPVPPGFGLTYPGTKSTSSNPFDFLPEIDVNLGIPASPSLIPTQSLVRGLGTTGTYRGIEIPGLTELLKRLSRRRTTGTGVGSYRNLGGY